MTKNVYDEQYMSHTRSYEWFKRFKECRQSTNDEPPLGRPSTLCDDAHVAQIREIVGSNRLLAVREIEEECNISIEPCHDIITTKLDMHWVV
jgi:hypothetical protein